MPTPSALTSAPPPRRPLNTLITILFLLMSAGGLWIIRVVPSLAGVPVNFDRHLQAGVMEDGTKLRTVYTGIAPVDKLLQMLVFAFLAGPARLDDGVWLQQTHFLVSFASVVFIMTVEACRRRNARRAICFTTVWALFYQTVAGACIVPLYYLAFVRTAADDEYYFSGREVTLSQAKAIVPAAVVGYLVPTLAGWLYPFSDMETLQVLTAIWQPSPIFVNILLFLLSPIMSLSAKPTTTKNADMKYLKAVYLVAALVTGAVHIGTLYLCFTSTNPQFAFSYVFLPNNETWKSSTVLGTHWIFQWDWLVIFAATTLFCWVSACDIRRVLAGGISVGYSMALGLSILVHVVVIGPGATLAALWYWREGQMALIKETRGNASMLKAKTG